MILTDVTLAEAGPDGFALTGDAAIAIEGGRIAFAGPAADLPPGGQRRSMGGRLVTPGLIDCHTHLVFGGDRAREFDMRLNGASYEEIARAGGGILSTVRATRAADEGALLAAALRRADHLIAEGVTTVEIKSGYGLDVQTELRMLRVARAVGRERPLRVVTTWLAAHALPPEFAGDRAGYIDRVVLDGLNAAHAEGLVDAVDGFCEGIAFSTDEMARIFDHARSLGLPVKLHAEQLSDLGGAAMAARHGAISADHLEWLGDDGIAAMAKAGTVAVMLPGAFYTLRETQQPPVDLLRKHGVAIAVASDCNPGTSPSLVPQLAMNMACNLFGLTPEEAIAGMTREAARALGLLQETGTLEIGKACDLAIWEIERPAELVYRVGFNPLHARVFAGSAAPGR